MFRTRGIEVRLLLRNNPITVYYFEPGKLVIVVDRSDPICLRTYDLEFDGKKYAVRVQLMLPVAYSDTGSDFACEYSISGIPLRDEIRGSMAGSDSMQALENSLAAIRSHLTPLAGRLKAFGFPFDPEKYPTPLTC